MALPVRVQMKYWGIAAASIVAALWLLGDVLLPFVLGGAIAYLLDPVADRLQRAGLGRAAAVAVITVVAMVVFGVLMLLVMPSLMAQAAELVEIAPQLITNLREFVLARFPDLLDSESTMRQSLVSLGERVQAYGGRFLETLLTSAASIVNVFLLLVIVPVVAVYLLVDWDNMVARIDELLPRDHAPVIRQLAGEIDRTLASFTRGMGTVCLILGTYYAAALMLVGLQFGLIVGFVAGLVTFIPYVGALFGGALALGLALFQFWGDWLQIAVVALVFVVGQVIEGNILTPKLVGGSVGLHPVWLLLALSVFGSLFGFIGLLLAVPLAAALGVIARFAARQYLGSRLYRGFGDE